MIGKIHSLESFSALDGPGARFTVFMQGCPMRCRYCHNPDTWNEIGGEKWEAEDLASHILRYSKFLRSGGVTVSGGEPMLQRGFVTELFEILKSAGMHTCLDTSGATFDPGDLANVREHEDLLRQTDLVLLDIKHIDAERHKALCGRGNEDILAFARFLDLLGVDVWIRHVLVEGYTDDDESLLRLRDFLDTLSNVKRVEVLPYHDMAKEKYERMGIDYSLKDAAPPTAERVESAERILGAGRFERA